jgi:hypothetical protein
MSDLVVRLRVQQTIEIDALRPFGSAIPARGRQSDAELKVGFKERP